MKEPTEEEIKRLWEWCGLEVKLLWGYYDDEFGYFKPNPTGKKTGFDTERRWCFQKREQQLIRWEALPPIDLNNLFKWAVPKLVDKGYDIGIFVNHHIVISRFSKKPEFYTEELADDISTTHLALFSAINKVIEGE